jgi:hypothetical protein
MPPWDEYKKPTGDDAPTGPWAAYAKAPEAAPAKPAAKTAPVAGEGDDDKPSLFHTIFGNAVGPAVEAGLNAGTSMLAKPAADVMGLAAMGRDALRDKPLGNAGDFRDQMQRNMTYQPATPAGQQLARYNPLALVGQGVNAVGGGVEQIIAPPGASTGRQMVGAGVHEGINQLPGFVGAKAPAMGRALEAPLKSSARDMMQSALKPSKAAQKSGDAATAIDTLLDTKTNVSKAGAEGLRTRIDDLNTQIADKIASSKAVIDKQVVADNLKSVLDDFSKQVNPSSDMHTVQAAYDEFLNSPRLNGKNTIPVQLAQEIKQGTYKQLGSKSYGEMKSADITAQKELARGLKEEIAKAVPEVRKLNAEDSKLLKTLPLVEQRVLMDANKNPIGLGWLTTNPTKFAAWIADRSPGFKSVVAHMLNAGSEAAGKVGRIGAKTPVATGTSELGLAPAGDRIPNLPRDTGRPISPGSLQLADLMQSSPGAGIQRPSMRSISGEGLYPDIHEAQRAALERKLSQGSPYRHDTFQPTDPLASIDENWSTSPGAGIPRPPQGRVSAEGMYEKNRPVRPNPQVLQMLGIDFHPTPIVDAEGYVARTAAEQEALRDPGVRASKEAQKKAAEERAAKAKKKKDEGK